MNSMKMEGNIVTVCIFLSFLGIPSTVNCAAWTYTDQNWQGVCSSGKKQSPIDILAESATKMHKGPLSWEKNATKLGNVVIRNNGHGFAVSGGSISDLILSGGGLMGTYKLAQFHYHWGDAGNQYKGSEHRIDGKQTASEMHLVHFSTKYDDLNKALESGASDALAVVGVMLKKAERTAAGHELILSKKLKDVKVKDTSVTADFGKVTLLQLLPEDVEHFYRYDGSLTTPTCNEAVIWTVLKEEVSIAKTVLDEFPKIQNGERKALTYTARDVMDLNGRKVYINTNGAFSILFPSAHVIFTLVGTTLALLC